MSQAFQQVTVTGVAAYPGAAQVTIPFVTLGVAVRNPLASTDGTVIAYSFDGVNDHGYLDKGETFIQQPSAPGTGGLSTPASVKVWLRTQTAGAGAGYARVWGWS